MKMSQSLKDRVRALAERRVRALTEEVRAAHAREPRLVAGLLAVFAIAALLPVYVAARLALDVRALYRDLPPQEAISRIGEMDQATTVYDDQDALTFTIFKEQRIEVPLEQVSPHLVDAILAIEDQRFYEHDGFDVVRIVSAAIANVRHQRVAQGGSTITQQLARQSFLVPDKTLRRKIQELILARRIEAQYAKPQILEMYLNKVYFGDGLYGIEAASRGYFNKHAAELTIGEAALLAGLVKSPSTYAPTVSMNRAVSRRNIVLQAMLDNGAIDRAAVEQAKASQVALHDGLNSEEPHGQYFKEQVRIELVDRFGWPRVYQGGLRVFTTINMPMQIAAEAAVAESMARLDERRQALLARRAAQRKGAPAADPEPLQAALVALDPKTGHVRALVGGRDFDDSRFNRATQARRQPGSAFKPFVYAAALESGYSPASIITNLDETIDTPQGAWTPDEGHSTGTEISLRSGLRISSNRAAVRLLQDVGIGRTVQYVKELGVGDVPSVPSLALGSGEVTLTSMTAAYAAFANAGEVPAVMLIRRVEDQDGRVLYEARSSSHRVLTETTAFLMSSMLADVVNAGTGSRARQLGFKLPAAGKTGTTNEFHDSWFVGYTPALVAGVWVGFDQPQTILPNGFASDIAVPVWAAFMKTATEGDKPNWFKAPRGVTTASVCRLSGQLATNGCHGVEVDNDGQLERRSMVYTEYFAPNTAPTESCELHGSRGLLHAVASILRNEEKPAPPRLADVGTLTPPPARPEVVAKAAEVPPAPEVKKKRGFWARVFGLGDDDKDSDDEKNDSDEEETESDGNRRSGRSRR
jgi:penicillin-binding protein 1A